MKQTTRYGLIEVKQPEFPTRKLWVVPHDGSALEASVFRPNYFSENLAEMHGNHSHPNTGKRISFREATTAESISIVARHNFKDIAKPTIFNSRRLHLGRCVKNSEGVFTNTDVTDDNVLKQFLDKAEKINGIYFINDIIIFVPYESFKQGVQDSEEFAEGGLARGLEHTREKMAENLAQISSKKLYRGGVNVSRLDREQKPVARIFELCPFGSFLYVYGDGGFYSSDGGEYGNTVGIVKERK